MSYPDLKTEAQYMQELSTCWQLIDANDKAIKEKDEQLQALAAQNKAMRDALELADLFIDAVRQDLHNQRIADWYPEGANNSALEMSESMRLIGNGCADFTAAVDALSIPDLATPILNKVRAEALRNAIAGIASGSDQYVDNPDTYLKGVGRGLTFTLNVLNRMVDAIEKGE